MPEQDSIALLGSIPLFSACNRSQLRAIAARSTEREVRRGEVLTEEGTRGSEFFVIEEGTAAVSLEGKTLADLQRGDFFGEMALLDQGPRSATVKATSPMRVRVFSAEDFGKFLDEAPDVGKRILRGVAARLRAVQGTAVSPHE